MNWPNYLKKMRRELDLTQTEMAEKLGVSYPTENRWENAHFKPSPLAKLAILALARENPGRWDPTSRRKPHFCRSFHGIVHSRP